MTACGNKESETVTPDNSTTPEAVETQPTQEATGTEETTSRDDTGVYPNATGLTEVAMGVTEDICTFRLEANAASIYITSVNGIAESGEIVNIDGNCNRVASIFYGHEKVYFVIGENKIEKDYDSALYRARNIAAPLNAQRLGVKTPCMCHEWYIIFNSGFMGSLDGKIKHFSETIHWIDVEGKYIPDVYHTILHILILCTLTITIIYSIRNRRKT